MVTLAHFFYLTGIMLAISLTGMILHRKNFILLLMCLELMLLAVNTNLIAISKYHGNVVGEILVFFTLTVAAAEAAIGLAIILLVYRHQKSIDVTAVNELRG